MPKTIKLTDKIPRVDIGHYLAASGEQSRVVVLSEKDVTVIRSYLYPGVEWETRFVRPLGGDNYETGTSAEFSEYLEMLNELDYRLSGGLSMSLETALESIADAITALAGAQSSTELTNIVRAISSSNVCCEQQIITQGGGVIGSIEQPIGGNDVPIFGTEEPLSLDPETFPEGYTSLEEYQLDKCQVSNLVVDGVIGTLRNLGAFGVFNGVALAGLIVAAIVGIIVFPPAFIPVAAAAIGFLSVEVTLLTLAANEMQENRDEWVCTIYNADGTDAAIAVLADLIDALIATIGATGGAAFWVKQILLLLFNADTLNKAMYKAAHITYPDADCSGCGGCYPIDLADWEGKGGTVVTVVGEGLNSTAYYYGGNGVYYADTFVGSLPQYDVVSLTFDFTPADEASDWRIQANTYDADGLYPLDANESDVVVVSTAGPVSLSFSTSGVTEEILIQVRRTDPDGGLIWDEVQFSNICVSGV